jgi:hypothetical protein
MSARICSSTPLVSGSAQNTAAEVEVDSLLARPFAQAIRVALAHWNALVEAFWGAALTLYHLNTKLALGESILKGQAAAGDVGDRLA